MMRSFRSCSRGKPVGWRRDNYRHYLAAKYGSANKTYFVGKLSQMIDKERKAELRKYGVEGENRSLDEVKDELMHDLTFKRVGKLPRSTEEMESRRKTLKEQMSLLLEEEAYDAERKRLKGLNLVVEDDDVDNMIYHEELKAASQQGLKEGIDKWLDEAARRKVAKEELRKNLQIKNLQMRGMRHIDFDENHPAHPLNQMLETSTSRRDALRDIIHEHPELENELKDELEYYEELVRKTGGEDYGSEEL